MNPTETFTERSSTGLDPVVAATLSYALVFISGIVLWAIERESRYVRFHAIQSTLLFSSLFLINTFAGNIPLVGWFAEFLVPPISVILWVVLMWKTYQRENVKLPIIGDFAARRA